jgi:hypothetical protein
MKSPTTTLKTTIAALAISAAMVLACSSTDSNETTEQQSSAAQPIANIETTNSQAPQEDQPTKEANLDTGSQTSDLPTTANAGSDNPTIERPSFGTATPKASDQIATPTQPLRQQQGGAVILAQPTPTMTPVPTPTSTPLPASTPYWQQFSKAEYEQFRPPAGPINWRKAEKCRFDQSLIRFLTDSTPAGILDRIEWDYDTAVYDAPVANTTLKAIRTLHPDLFKSDEVYILNMCGNLEALHPQIPVVRTTFAIDVHSGKWTNPETGQSQTIWKAYRIEARYIYTEGEDRPRIEQLGTILIEPLGYVCNRDDRPSNWDDPMCQVPLN